MFIKVVIVVGVILFAVQFVLITCIYHSLKKSLKNFVEVK